MSSAESLLREILAQPIPDVKRARVYSLLQDFRYECLRIVADAKTASESLGSDPSTFERHLRLEEEMEAALEAARNALKDAVVKVLKQPHP